MNENPSFTVITKNIDGYTVTISKPTDENILGITFLLPGSNIAVEEYNSHRDVLISENQIVLSFYINVLWPLSDNHRTKAKAVKKVFDIFYSKYAPKSIPEKYSIVGHSVGGKIALLVPTLYDHDRVMNVIALDPVDQSPSEFTNSSTQSDISLQSLLFPIILTLTDGGNGISKDHDAHAIHEKNLTNTVLIRHEGAGHMAYTDHGGGYLGDLVPKGTPEGDKAGWEGAHDLIRKYVGGKDQVFHVHEGILTENVDFVSTSNKRFWFILVGIILVLFQMTMYSYAVLKLN